MSATPNTRHITATQTARHYDAIVVGARAAGASTAMLLARQGARVLVIDRAKPGADTLSTHALMRGAVRQLHRWGLLDRVVSNDTPPIRHATFRYGTEEVTIDVKGDGTVAALYAPRRTVLDPILVDAARDAGATVQHETRLLDLQTDAQARVTGVVIRRGERTETISADLVIGADGLRSTVARNVGAPITRLGEAANASIISYVRDSGLPSDSYFWVNQPGLLGGTIPTNDGQHVVFVSQDPKRFNTEARSDIPTAYKRLLADLGPDIAAAVASGTQVGSIRSWPGHVGQFRKPYGPGWALVGDAGYFKDPAATHGITDAFRDAELLANAVRTGDFAGYEHRRDELSAPLFDVLEAVIANRSNVELLPALHVDMARAMNAEHRMFTAHLDSIDTQRIAA
jgi:flavin-dependent dehydrogenase